MKMTKLTKNKMKQLNQSRSEFRIQVYDRSFGSFCTIYLFICYKPVSIDDIGKQYLFLNAGENKLFGSLYLFFFLINYGLLKRLESP